MYNQNPSPSTRIKPGQVLNPNGRRNNGMARLLEMVRKELGEDSTQEKVKTWVRGLDAKTLWREVVLPLAPKESNLTVSALTPTEARVIFADEVRRLESGGGVDPQGSASSVPIDKEL